MELMLPKELTREKTYRHFTFGADSERELPLYPSKIAEFVFIGSDTEKVDVLMRSFEGGYALENVKSAIACFKRMLETKSVPETIIVDGRIGEAAIKQVYNYLSSVSQLSFIPFLLEASHLSEAELKKYRKLAFIDEIIFLKNITDEKLVSKINFLKKVKYKTLVNKPVLKTVDKRGFRLPLLLKRLFDIVFASIAILLLSPFFLLVALLIKLESKGPVFYIALRAGRGYKIFKFYKFRTMIVDADKKVQQLSHLNQYTSTTEGPVFFKLSNDPRITKVGTFLRNTSLDELPQLFNVLLGDMSLVGNRPLPLYEAATLTTDQHAARFMAPAGITGLWQVKKRGNSNMSAEERINLDIDYAQKCSFVTDLWIIAQTPTALIQKENV
jgi:lipopolysaccharide/colanic/teichoic acid biosynthesis glycosyltransferase